MELERPVPLGTLWATTRFVKTPATVTENPQSVATYEYGSVNVSCSGAAALATAVTESAANVAQMVVKCFNTILLLPHEMGAVD